MGFFHYYSKIISRGSNFVPLIKYFPDISGEWQEKSEILQGKKILPKREKERYPSHCLKTSFYNVISGGGACQANWTEQKAGLQRLRGALEKMSLKAKLCLSRDYETRHEMGLGAACHYLSQSKQRQGWISWIIYDI